MNTDARRYPCACECQVPLGQCRLPHQDCDKCLAEKKADPNQAINEGLDKMYGTVEKQNEPRFISVCCDRDPCKCGKEDYGPGEKASNNPSQEEELKVTARCACGAIVKVDAEILKIAYGIIGCKHCNPPAKENCNGCPRAAKLETRLAEHFYTKHEIDERFGALLDYLWFTQKNVVGLYPEGYRILEKSIEDLRRRFL